MTAPERVMAKVTVDLVTDCWVFNGHLGHHGYGQIRVGGRAGSLRYVHRVMFEHHVGPIPEGMQIDHLCRVRACCNPRHLETVTPRENQLRGNGRGGINARKTHCPQGHPYDEENTLRDGRGWRRCRTCKRLGRIRYAR